VRPAGNARQLADKENDIRYYSIIYAAIDDLKEWKVNREKEEVLGTAEIREIFKNLKLIYCRLYG
jgi:translation initiation factor IF-2